MIGLVAIFAVFQSTATVLGSDRGQGGILVAAFVVAAAVLVERIAFKTPFARTPIVLGLSLPRSGGLLGAVTVSVLLLITIPVYARATGASFALRTDWWSLVPGLFAQAGIAEEVLFRGYLFGHVRRGRHFWQAAALSIPPFVAVHLILLATMPMPVAVAAILLAVVIGFPLARLFDLGGATIWPSALLHFVIQSAVKVIDLMPQRPR